MPLIVGSDPQTLEEFPLDLPTRAYLGDSGIVLGGDVDAYGCRWKAKPSDFWGAKPAPRENTGDRPYDHGQWDATKYFGPRVWSGGIPGTVHAPDHATLHAAKQRLFDAVSIDYFTYRVTEPGFDGYAMVRQQGEPMWTENSHTHASFNIGIYAPDPLIYSTLERIFALDFPVVTGGLTWPATWPATWAGTGVVDEATLSNPGALPIALKLRVTGPVDTVSIAFPDFGTTLNLENPLGDILAAGAWLDIDPARRQVLLNGEASRRSWMYGDWLYLPPKSDTKIAVAATGPGLGAGVSGSYRVTRI